MTVQKIVNSTQLDIQKNGGKNQGKGDKSIFQLSPKKMDEIDPKLLDIGKVTNMKVLTDVCRCTILATWFLGHSS